MKAYKAYSKHGHVTADTPRDAAQVFFNTFPSARKCDIVEGEHNGDFFTVTYGRASLGEWPRQYKDVTKKTVSTLPCEGETK